MMCIILAEVDILNVRKLSYYCLFSNLFQKMINGGTIDNWTCLNFSRMRPEEVQRFCMDLTHMCNATGMVSCPLLGCVMMYFILRSLV